LRSALIISVLRRPSLLVSGAFVALTAGIVANALYLQPGRHPAPLFLTRPADQAEPAHADRLVQSIQAALRDAGYYSGRVDGIAGPDTTAAITAFEKSTGRAGTGQASAELLAVLRPAPAAPTPPRVPQAAPDPRVAAVQSALSKAAYGQLTADGYVGPQTRDAIVRFEQDHGLPANGEVTDALMVELRAVGALDAE
jgi:peptidoglycan hydrolase-like protein with peptidoglycan-binding domain